VIAGDEHILVLLVRAQMAASHAADGGAVQPGEAAVLRNAEGHHALVRDGVEGLSVAGSDHIGGVVHLHLTPFLERSRFHVHIKNRDSLCFPGVGVGPYICHIFTFHRAFTSQNDAF